MADDANRLAAKILGLEIGLDVYTRAATAATGTPEGPHFVFMRDANAAALEATRTELTAIIDAGKPNNTHHK